MVLEKYACCRHCPEICGAVDNHMFPCKTCQPSLVDGPIELGIKESNN